MPVDSDSLPFSLTSASLKLYLENVRSTHAIVCRRNKIEISAILSQISLRKNGALELLLWVYIETPLPPHYESVWRNGRSLARTVT